MSTSVPEIARRVSPEECRQLIEFLLGGPLKKGSVGISHETVDSPTEDQKKQEHVPLSHGRIMLLHSRGELHFETDWHQRGDRSLSGLDELRAVYLGAVASGRIRHHGSSVECRHRWQEIVKGAGAPVAGEAPKLGRTVSRVAVEAVVRGVINKIVENLDKLKDLFPGA